MPNPSISGGTSAQAAIDTSVDRPIRPPKARQVLTGLGSSYLQSGVSLLVGFIATPLYLGYLGTERFGLWMTLWSIIGYLNLSTFGMPTTSAVRLAEAYARGDDQSLSRTLVTAFLSWLSAALIATAVLILLVAVRLIRPEVFSGSAAVANLAVPAMLILLAGFLLSQPLDVFRLAIRSFQRVDLEQRLTTILRLCMLAVSGSILALGGGLIGLSVVTSVCQLGFGLLFVAVVYRLVPGLRLSPLSFSGSTARSLIVPSLQFFAISVAGSLIWGTDNVVISTNLGSAAVVPFAVGMQLLNVGSGLIASTINAVLPAVTALNALGDQEKLRRTLFHVIKIEFALASLIVVGLLSFGTEFLRLWVGPEHVAATQVLCVLLAVFFVRGFAMSFEMIVVGTLRHRSYAYMALAEGLLNLTLSLILVKQLGLLGVALGTLLAHLACTGWFLPVRGMSISGSRWTEVVKGIILRTLPAAVAALVVAEGFLRLPIATGWGHVSLGSGLTTVTFAVVFALLGLSAKEKEQFRLIRNKMGLP
jgi:O-antigen/teichoic acid export membrane protein